MNMKSILADAKTDWQNFESWARSFAENRIPALEAEISKIENDPFVRQYLGSGLAVPEHLVSVGLDFLSKLIADWQATGQPTAAPPAAEPAPQADQTAP